MIGAAPHAFQAIGVRSDDVLLGRRTIAGNALLGERDGPEVCCWFWFGVLLCVVRCFCGSCYYGMDV